MQKTLHRGDQDEPAATKIIRPSMPAGKVLGLAVAEVVLSSAGARNVQATNATTAATRFTPDSAASDRSPTDPVRR